MIDTRGIVGAT